MEHWSQFWGGNKFGDCFSLDGNSNLTHVLIHYWNDYFTKKEISGFVLDLACGNGFVGKCAIKKMKETHCIGVEQAIDIETTHYHDVDTGSQLKILKGLSIAETRFVENEFDLVVSQFGLEYAVVNESLIKHVIKQIKPGGELNFIAHHSKSFICIQSEKELKIIKYINNQQKIFNGIRKLINSSSEEERDDFIKGIIEKGIEIYGEGISEVEHIFQLIIKLVASIKYGVQREHISELESHYIAYEKRLEEQLNVALSPQKLNDLISIIKNENVSYINSQIFHNEKLGLIGWEINVKVEM
ncbi:MULTISPECIES: class I SAM-dependent methyltransferase [unclassified Pseudoalteromonas]|uniref:class I SAM-dependent methyltransferase n=1 Tax=unclassified Pseudoalteromonas TaxID=194690 RepID=UPI0005A91AA9|nr:MULTISPECIES: class I SAM-dependent methyltransferase [unclassified Pseudoalteromonas]